MLQSGLSVKQQRDREYYQRHKEEIKARTRKYAQEHKEELRVRRAEYFAQYRRRTRSDRRKKAQQWRKENPRYFHDYYRCNSTKLKDKSRAYYLDNHDKCLEALREYNKRPEARARKIAQQRKDRLRRPQVYRARRLLGRAVNAGVIKKAPCELCGSVKVEAHHPSYEVGKELDVRWLCRYHHRLVEGKVLIPREDLGKLGIDTKVDAPNEGSAHGTYKV